MERARREKWRPSEEQMRLWPVVSGNRINGVGESAPRPPSPIYWHAPEATPHGPLQRFFYEKSAGDRIAQARKERQRLIDEPMAPISSERVEKSAAEWTAELKRQAASFGADAVGVTSMRPEWVFEGKEVPPQKWMLVIGVRQDYAVMANPPSESTLLEITRQYGRGILVAKSLANWLRRMGHDALPYGGPMAGSFLLIPAAIEAGLGELGKHGSLINRELDSNFRLACVLTDVPLLADKRDNFGADAFCAHCRVCVDACPPDAISHEKQLVRGVHRWYVDFDKCLPYFNENKGCGICMPACPFSRPGVSPGLAHRLETRRSPRA